MCRIFRNLAIILVLILLAYLQSCSAPVYETQDPNKFYRLDLEMEWDGHLYKGIAVLPERPAYELRFKSPGKMDVFSFKTCSREEVREKSEFRGSPYRAVVHYSPNEIELRGACIAEVSSYEKINGRNSSGLIDFEDGSTTLKAKILCGGETTHSNGVSICQQREGLLQKIKFKEVVVVKPDTGCALESGTRGMVFEFAIKRGLCIYTFMGVKPPHEVHRLLTYGYQEILLRRD